MFKRFKKPPLPTSEEIVSNTVAIKLCSEGVFDGWGWANKSTEFFNVGGNAQIEAFSGGVKRVFDVCLVVDKKRPAGLTLVPAKAAAIVQLPEEEVGDEGVFLRLWFNINLCAIEDVVSQLRKEGESVVYINKKGDVYTDENEILAILPSMPNVQYWEQITEMFDETGLLARSIDSEGIIVISWEVEHQMECA